MVKTLNPLEQISRRWQPSARFVRRAALATVVTAVAIVVTGGAVRLTQSGLGCPTWPRCTAESLTPTGEMGHVWGGQYAGYLFPMGPFYALGHVLGLGGWVVERLWLGGLLALAAWGTVRLLDALLERERGAAHLIAGAIVLLNPYVVVFTNRTSVTLLDDTIAEWSATVATDELIATLRADGVPVGRIYRAPEMLVDPHFQARESITRVKHPTLGELAMQNVMPPRPASMLRRAILLSMLLMIRPPALRARWQR